MVAVRWATVLVLSVICLEIFVEINVVVCPWALALTFCSYKKLAIFITNVDAENQRLINHKCVCGVLNRQFFVGAVMCSLSSHLVVNSALKSVLSNWSSVCFCVGQWFTMIGTLFILSAAIIK